MGGGGERGEKKGGRTGHKGERVCLCLCRSPRGDCGIVEVNESDWLLGVFLLVLRFAHSERCTFSFFFSFFFFHFTKFGCGTVWHEGQSGRQEMGEISLTLW